ncbi:unnamed protein product [Calicophoron daubneyi]|uniref:DNA primase n=1 Tax=Calicophoron daubneyi TaxID=300641 RepID=A0AAV2TA88_CALDB
MTKLNRNAYGPSTMSQSNEISDELLRIYYKKLFPCELFSKWLTYGSNDLVRREFSFTLAGDVYIRYQSFETAAELRRELVKSCPHKIDIGAVYCTAPKKHRSILPSSFKPEWKELVFDIDLTDYDEVRFCCGAQNPGSSSAVCRRCWLLAQSAVMCIDRALREDFGFEHLLWVYSGRRGVHCWVCDSAARKLDPVARAAIVDYLTLVRAGGGTKPSLTAGKQSARLAEPGVEPMFHPCVDAASNILLPRFGTYCSTLDGQDLFGVPDRLEKLLSFLPSDLDNIRGSLAQDWLENPSKDDGGEVSVRRWNTLRTFLSEGGRTNVARELVLNYTYPRLDVNVSTGLNHLLKSPFCVHPKTGFVCVPFDPASVSSFDPLSAPTLSQVIEQSGSRKEDELTEETGVTSSAVQKHLLAYKKTSLRPAIEYFESFIDRLCSSQSEAMDTSNSVRVNDSGLKNGPLSVPVF